MIITILGSGTATPMLERNASGLVVQTNDVCVMVDMGPGIIRRMCEAGIDTRRVDVILLTHFHPDHVSDVPPFLFASNYAYGPVREEEFLLAGPVGLEQFYNRLVELYQGRIVPRGDRLKVAELDGRAPSAFETGSVMIRYVATTHGQPSLAYRIEADGASVTVSGDTDLSEKLVELATDTDVLVCECSMPDGRKVPGHLVPSEAGEIAALAGAKTLVLTHFYPPCDETDVVAQAASVFDGTVVKAHDHMKLHAEYQKEVKIL